jgi:MFS family permease
VAGVSAQTTDLVPPVVVLLTLASFCLGYLIPLQTEVAALIPNSVRGRIFGLAQAILQLAQGAAILIAGAIASRLDVGIALIITGAFGVLAVLVVGGSMRRPAGVHRGIRNGSQ